MISLFKTPFTGTALLILAAFSPGAMAQHFGFGIKAGAPFTDVVSSSSIGTIAESGHFVVGPMVELRIPLLAIEADALYHGGSYTLSQSNVPQIHGGAGSWQFPIVGKVKLPTTPILKPYGEAGIAFRKFTDSSQLDAGSKKGFVVGAGLDIHAIILHITPELRYTRWGSRTNIFLQPKDNQFEFLVGFSR